MIISAAWKRVIVATFVGMPVVALVSCGSRKPSWNEAADLIRASPAFTNESVMRTVGLSRGRCIMRQFDPDAEENRRYLLIASAGEGLGWLHMVRRRATEKECGWLMASVSDVVQIELTKEGQEARLQWPSRPVADPASQFARTAPDWNLPLQRRQFVDITGIADPNNANGEVAVEFKWQIIWPLGGSPEPRRGVATFRRYDTGWRVEQVDGVAL